jgi:hypothetical protein
MAVVMKRSTKKRARFLVDFVLDRVRVHRDFDHDVKGVGNVLAGGDLVEGHGMLLMDGLANFHAGSR